ncbi:MAG: hypothetical protein L0Z55_06800, partial [Planctomycetes bacterium]|nr:hypothetical protein [Planctomycetota bacterium]
SRIDAPRGCRRGWNGRAAGRAAAIIACLLAAGLALDLSGAARAEPPVSDEEAVALVKGAIVALGGADAQARAANFKAEYQARALPEQPGLSVAFQWTIVKRDDGAIRIEKRVMDEREIFGTDGKDAWRVPPGSDDAEAAPEVLKRVLELEELQQSILFRYKERGFIARMARAEAAAPAGLKKVSFQREEYAARADAEKPGDVIDFYFDPKSFLPARSVLLVPDPAGGRPYRMTTHYHDYEAVDGVPIPRRLLIYRGEQLIQEAKMTSVEIGKRQPDSLFKKPIAKN